MKRPSFDQLTESTRRAGQICRGERKCSLMKTFSPDNIRAICMRTHGFIHIISVAFVCFAVSGCGAGARKSAAEASAEKYFAAFSQKDLDTAVSLYSSEFFEKCRKRIGGSRWRPLRISSGIISPII